MDDDVLDLERRGWQALASGPDAATTFYRGVLGDHPLFLFPGGTVVEGRDAVLTSMGGPPWSTWELWDERVVDLGADARLVAYRARAERAGDVYEALVASTYVSDGSAWRLVVHQQTPA